MRQPSTSVLPSMRRWRSLWLLAALVLYLLLACYQLGLPGLHYDEAREAGVNAMELLTGAPVTAFRNVSITLGNQPFPLMVQDYIGALNVYLALPFLALTGIGVPNLRFLSVFIGLAALLLLERAVSEWQATREDVQYGTRFVATPITTAGLVAITLLAASPSFVFWSRQGIFVTNLTQPLCFLSIWQGLHWLRCGRPRSLYLSALAGGLAIYAKLIAGWVIGPFVLLAGGWWIWQRTRSVGKASRLSLPTLLVALCCFVLPLTPLLLFYGQTGALNELFGKLDQSYYGVDNRDLLHNFPVRWGQLWQSLRGDHLWYLGGIYANPLAPWLAGIAMGIGLLRAWRTMAFPLALLTLTFACSLFTVSDLFVTHYALVQPLLVAVVAIGITTVLGQKSARLRQHQPVHQSEHQAVSFYAFALVFVLLTLWLGADLLATTRYHAVLTRSGGVADHSDANYDLAYYLRYNGLGSPLALDWGMDAPVRYLSEGKVTPIEIFGYTSLAAPDPDFATRLQPFLANQANVYLLRAPDQAVFQGRRERFFQVATSIGLTVEQVAQFEQRDGNPVFELWRTSR